MRERVEQVLTGFLDDQRRVLGELGDDCEPLLEAVTTLLAGGKRLRPAFCYWGFRGADGGVPDASEAGIVTAAAALELFQAAALLHDDVMDDSDTRRGKPAAHRWFAGVHADAGWSGSAERFGLAGAVLAGDLCLAWSDELYQRAPLGADALRRGRRVFETMRTQLMGGQYLDMLEQAASARLGPVGAVDRARRVVRFKSAKYSVEHPLLLGATLAGAPEALLADLSRFGLALGEAFQLRDDVLGVFGDPGETGKPAGDDLREGKRTVLVALALQSSSPAQAAVVARHLGDPALDEDGVAALRRVLVDTGALDGVERIIDEQVDVACSTLDAAPLAEPAREALHELVVAATSRRS
ncbi:polyprenyl synthetase family protein [Kineococcus sp. G2]|uniref:polyprenyl synthetase family protein n=1 Tax=Kineococcus sp. G2 TaxID=3127484 RepID=UPI003FA606CC